jgi:hypothetical protein
VVAVVCRALGRPWSYEAREDVVNACRVGVRAGDQFTRVEARDAVVERRDELALGAVYSLNTLRTNMLVVPSRKKLPGATPTNPAL